MSSFPTTSEMVGAMLDAAQALHTIDLAALPELHSIRIEHAYDGEGWPMLVSAQLGPAGPYTERAAHLLAWADALGPQGVRVWASVRAFSSDTYFEIQVHALLGDLPIHVWDHLPATVAEPLQLDPEKRSTQRWHEPGQPVTLDALRAYAQGVTA